jgi:hypothetical protein
LDGSKIIHRPRTTNHWSHCERVSKSSALEDTCNPTGFDYDAVTRAYGLVLKKTLQKLHGNRGLRLCEIGSKENFSPMGGSNPQPSDETRC